MAIGRKAKKKLQKKVDKVKQKFEEVGEDNYWEVATGVKKIYHSIGKVDSDLKYWTDLIEDSIDQRDEEMHEQAVNGLKKQMRGKFGVAF